MKTSIKGNILVDGEIKEVELNKKGELFASVKSVDGDSDGDNFVVNILASTADVDRMDDIVDTHAFDDTLKDFERVGIILHQHDPKQPIGRPLSAKYTNRGLEVKAMISSTVPNIQKMIKEGILRQASIGFRVLDHEFKKVGDSVILFIKKLELFEVSLVSIAANPFTDVSMAKAFYTEVEQPERVVDEVEEEIKNAEGEEVKEEKAVSEEGTEPTEPETESKHEEEVEDLEQKGTSENPEKVFLAFDSVLSFVKSLTNDQALELKDLILEKTFVESNENTEKPVKEENSDELFKSLTSLLDKLTTKE